MDLSPPTAAARQVSRYRDGASLTRRVATHRLHRTASDPLATATWQGPPGRSTHTHLLRERRVPPGAGPSVARVQSNETRRLTITGSLAKCLRLAPHAPDAWMDRDKDRIGYEISFNRYFYKYTPPRPLEEIDADLKEAEEEIVRLLREVTG